MKKTMTLALVLCLTGCACGQSKKEKLLRRALADMNVALTEAQDRATARQLQAERLARKLYRHHHKA